MHHLRLLSLLTIITIIPKKSQKPVTFLSYTCLAYPWPWLTRCPSHGQVLDNLLYYGISWFLDDVLGGFNKRISIFPRLWQLAICLRVRQCGSELSKVTRYFSICSDPKFGLDSALLREWPTFQVIFVLFQIKHGVVLLWGVLNYRSKVCLWRRPQRLVRGARGEHVLVDWVKNTFKFILRQFAISMVKIRFNLVGKVLSSLF
jgi:hypothetical protein